MTSVYVPELVGPAAYVEIDADGAVTWAGELIGYVWKGSRTYSPPTHRGSRIARYHKQVPEWHGSRERGHMSPEYRRDTRRRVLQDLVDAAASAHHGRKP